MRHNPPAFALFTTVLVVLLVGADEPYTSKPGNFRAAFPAAPRATRLNATSPGGVKVAAHAYAAKDKDGAVYSVNYADYPDATPATLDVAIDSMIKSAKMGSQPHPCENLR